MKKVYIFFLLLTSLGFQEALGQLCDRPEVSCGHKSAGTAFFGISYAQPLASFRQAYPQADALGGTIGILVNPRKGPSPLEVGVQAGLLSQGRTINRTSPGTNFAKVKTTHAVIPLHFVARVKPRHHLSFQPYADGLAGITVLNTRSKIKEDIFDFLQEDYQTVVLTKHKATLLSFGFGAGVLYMVPGAKGTGVDIRLTYLQSPFADYVQKGHVRIEPDGFPLYNFTRSETSMWQLQLNITGILTSLN